MKKKCLATCSRRRPTKCCTGGFPLHCGNKVCGLRRPPPPCLEKKFPPNPVFFCRSFLTIQWPSSSRPFVKVKSRWVQWRDQQATVGRLARFSFNDDSDDDDSYDNEDGDDDDDVQCDQVARINPGLPGYPGIWGKSPG